MPTLTKATEIITLDSTPEDRRLAAEYASRTLPWTYNRMSKSSSVNGQNDRGLNIAKGIVAQEVLRREIERNGIGVELQRKSHRDKDLFDFHIVHDGTLTKFDVKSISYYNDYADVGRPPFSKQLVIDNKAYPGPDWRKFFPMMMAHNQIEQPKDAYIFAISESIDFRRKVLEGRSEHLIVAYPFGEPIHFYTKKKLCLAREAAGKGFYISIAYEADGLFSSAEGITIDVLYEWNNAKKKTRVKIKAGEKSNSVGPISVFNCISLPSEEYERFTGAIFVKVAKNEFKDFVGDSSMTNINEVPDTDLAYTPKDFCNLVLPDRYALHYLGWIQKRDFLEACKKYPAYVWPIDKINRFENSEWSQVKDRDIKMLQSLGMIDRLDKKSSRISLGLLKTAGPGKSGACCYVFPNIFRSGLKETNIYVLPQDLQTLSSLTSAKVQTIGV